MWMLFKRYWKSEDSHIDLLIIVLLAVVVLLSTCNLARAEGLHLSEVVPYLGQKVSFGQVEGVGLVYATDTDADGAADAFYLIYKDFHFKYSISTTDAQLHVRPLTEHSLRYLVSNYPKAEGQYHDLNKEEK